MPWKAETRAARYKGGLTVETHGGGTYFWREVELIGEELQRKSASRKAVHVSRCGNSQNSLNSR